MTGPEIRAMRLSLGLSQHHFARRYKIKTNTLRTWEQGVRNPSPKARSLLKLIKEAPIATAQMLASER